jgi:uncharacterized protein YbjT (DUF2867 family)
MSKSNLLVFGATGAIGSYIIAAIVNAKDSFGRIAVFTSPNTLSTKATEINALRDNGVEIITGDVTKKEDVVAAFQGAFHASHPPPPPPNLLGEEPSRTDNQLVIQESTQSSQPSGAA